MVKLPLLPQIEIRPIVHRTTPTPDLYDRKFLSAFGAAEFMIMKNWDEWKLYIRGRLYNWPPSSCHYRVLIEHILQCIDTDLAFYDD